MNGEMKLRDIFSELNPLVCLVFYVSVIGITITTQHLLVLLISLAGSFLVTVNRKGLRTAVLRFARILPLALITSVLNPMFSHEGVSILAYLPGGNPLTLESLLYGGAAGLMMLNTLGWFMNFSEMMTSEKWIYLFGKAIPALSLTLSMIFRFVPKLLARIRQTYDALAQSEKNTDSFRGKLHLSLYTLSAVLSWALEDAAETADSMRCRGYGLPGRTVYANYGFDVRDGCFLVLILILAGITFAFRPEWNYYPVFYMENSIICFVCYGSLCLIPALLGYLTELTYGLRIRRLSK